MKKVMLLFMLIACRGIAEVVCSLSLEGPTGIKVVGADVVLVDREKKIVYSAEYDNGLYVINIPADKPLELAIAHPDFCALLKTVVAPSKLAKIVLKQTEKTGSVMAKNATCYIPKIGGAGSEGRLNIKSGFSGRGRSTERLSLFAKNLSIEDGKAQPVHFVRRVPLRMEDSAGKAVKVEILDVIGKFSILQYTFL